MVRIRWTTLAVLVGSLALLPARASTAQPAPTPAATASAATDSGVRRDMQQLAATLEGATSTQAQRDEAARRLVSRQTPEAQEILARTLRDGAHDAELATARALADDPRPNPRFVETLGQLLGAERSLHEAAARALARYTDNDTARDRLIAFAKDARQVTGLRTSVIRAMGSMVDKRVAQALIDLLTDARQGPAIQNAAADGLVEMTGLTENGRDAQRWRQWDTANAGRPEAAWKAAVYATRAAHLEGVAQKYRNLIAELDAILTERYQAAPDKSEALMRYLNSSEPDVRAIGAHILRDAFGGGQEYPKKAPERLKELVGDSDLRVRLEVARTLKAINYAPALDALLTQLAQEQDPDVKIALIGAVAQTGDLKTLDLLRKLLHDPSLRVATAAAEAFVPRGGAAGKALGQILYATDRDLAHAVAQDLWQTMQRQSTQEGSEDFRAASVEAIAPLRDPSLLVPLTRLLDPNESDRTRSAALRALGELGDPNTDDAIRGWLLQEPVPSVRLEALDALGKTGSFGADAEALYNFFGPRTAEADPSVRARAWQVFQGLLPTASKQVLNDWAHKLSKEPDRRLAVLLELNRKLLKDRDLEQLAESQQNTGEVFMKLAPPQPEQAAIYFHKALEYWQSRGVESEVTEGLVQQLMIAYLKSRNFKDAVDFAAASITASKAQQSTMGPLIRDEAATLMQKNDPTDLKDALTLIDSALKMKPPLADVYQDDLRQLQKEAQQKLAGQPPA